MSPPVPPVMLIVGGTGSIGGEIARMAAAAGWRVALHGRTRATVEAGIDRLTDGNAEGFPCDLSDGGTVEGLVAAVGDRLGRIDAVVDCVTGGAPGVTGPFRDTRPDAYGALADASLVHFQRLSHVALPWLGRNGGALIAFASDAGLFAARNQSMIAASRAAIIAFVRNLSLEAAHDGVRVHCISPSFVLGSASIDRLEAAGSPRIEKARARAGLGLPTVQDIAPMVLFLCGDQARRITGQVISINGGLNA